MWGSLLLVAVVAGADPVRVGLVAVMLGRPRPVPLLTGFVLAGMGLNVAVGAVLLVLGGQVAAGQRDGLPAPVELAIGAIALAVAVVVAAGVPGGVRARVRARRGDRLVSAAVGPAATPDAPAGVERLPGFARLPPRAQAGLRGDAAWAGWALGACMGFPTPYYLAGLAAVLAADASPAAQVGALIVFNMIGFGAALVPLAGFAVAPAATRRVVGRVYGWLGEHHRLVLAVIAAVVGLYFTVSGWRHL